MKYVEQNIWKSSGNLCHFNECKYHLNKLKTEWIFRLKNQCLHSKHVVNYGDIFTLFLRPKLTVPKSTIINLVESIFYSQTDFIKITFNGMQITKLWIDINTSRTHYLFYLFWLLIYFFLLWSVNANESSIW